MAKLLSDNRLENAKLCRERAYEVDDPRVMRFLLELADDYEEIALAATREADPDH